MATISAPDGLGRFVKKKSAKEDCTQTKILKKTLKGKYGGDKLLSNTRTFTLAGGSFRKVGKDVTFLPAKFLSGSFSHFFWSPLRLPHYLDLSFVHALGFLGRFLNV